jgi:hypothetical protein
METEKSLVRTSDVQLPKFVADAYDTIEGMKQFAGMLLDSKLVPDHFYEKGTDNKPDYTKGKVPAVVVVLLQAQQLAIPPMTALQHVIPVNGLLSIKGDLAKTMIFASGKLKKDSWIEDVTGSIEQENMVITIQATRDDNGITLTRFFSVDKAKRMGLWITSAQVNGTDGWKYKKSAWYKTPDRMLMYRALGNIARDLFSDVLLNMYTTEEAQDIQRETTEVIETESGAKITIPDKEHAKGRSDKMTGRVADKIKAPEFAPIKSNASDAVVMTEENFTDVGGFRSMAFEAENPGEKYDIDKHRAEVNALNKVPVEQKEESPFIPSHGSVEFHQGVEVQRDETPPLQTTGEYTLEGMEKTETEVLKEIVMADMDMMEASELLGGKNTNKKLRLIIFANQEGKLKQYVADELSKIKKEEPPAEPPVDTARGEIPLNKDFDNQGPAQGTPTRNADILQPDPPKEKVVSGNKYGLEIPEAIPRDFSVMKSLHNKLLMLSPTINNSRYEDLSDKLNIRVAFPDKETFLKNATTAMVNQLLDTN